MNRRKLAYNSLSALVKEFVSIVCGFILPQLILRKYGSTVNGLIASITQFLSFITLLEMGIGPVIQSNLYEPLARKDKEEISKIFVSARKFFNKLSFIFVCYIVILFFVYPIIINEDFDFLFTASLVVIISISTLSQYLFGIAYQLLLNADQRAYIPLSLQAITICLNTLVCILLIKLNFSIHLVKLVSSLIYVIRPLAMMSYVNKRYDIDYYIQYEGEPIRQKWNGLAQHLSGVVVSNTDVTVLSFLSSIKDVSIYSVYFNVVFGVSTIVLTVATGLEAFWGNMLANNEVDSLNKSFNLVEIFIHCMVTWLFIITSILIVPFVRVYTNGLTDANYIVPGFAMTLVFAYGVQCLRIPYFRVIKAAGQYKETQMASVIQMIINIGLSVAFVYKLGLLGVAIGTLVAMLFHTFYCAWYIKNHIIYREFRFFAKHFIIDITTGVISILLTMDITMSTISYLSWVVLAVKVTIICSVIVIGINAFIYYKSIACFFKDKRNRRGGELFE